MRGLQRALAVLTAVAAVAGTVAITAGPASAAMPYCNNVSGLSDDSAGRSRYVTYWTGSGNPTPDCNMNYLNENGTEGQRRAIKQLQWDLIFCYGQNISYDGEYGPGTRQAVINVQNLLNASGAGLGVDGWAGPKTRKAMRHVAVEETFCARVSNPQIDVFTWAYLDVPDYL